MYGCTNTLELQPYNIQHIKYLQLNFTYTCIIANLKNHLFILSL